MDKYFGSVHLSLLVHSVTFLDFYIKEVMSGSLFCVGITQHAHQGFLPNPPISEDFFKGLQTLL